MSPKRAASRLAACFCGDAGVTTVGRPRAAADTFLGRPHFLFGASWFDSFAMDAGLDCLTCSFFSFCCCCHYVVPEVVAQRG